MTLRKRICLWRRFIGLFLPRWLARRIEISLGGKLCYGRMGQFAGRKDCCHPKQAVLAKELGVSERMVRNYLAELVRHGLIEVEQRGLRKSNRYYFLEHRWMFENPADTLSNSGQSRRKSSGPDRNELAGPLGRESGERDSAEEIPSSPQGDDGDGDISSLASDCEEVFAAYPKKVGKPSAIRAIRKAIGRHGLHVVLDGTKRYAANYKGETRFIPHPARYYSEDRFMDDPATWSSTASPSRQQKPPRHFDPTQYNQNIEQF